MTVLAYVRLALKSIIKELPAFVIGFAIFPIFIGLSIGFAQKNMFSPKINEPLFTISVMDEDNSWESQELIAFLQSEQVSQILTVDVHGDADYVLSIPDGYGLSLVGAGEATIKVELSKDASRRLGNTLASIVEMFNTEFSRGLVREQKIAKLQEELQVTEVGERIRDNLTKITPTAALQTKIHGVKKSFTSTEYYSIKFLLFVFSMLLLAMINAEELEKKMGIADRVLSTPVTRIMLFNSSFLSGYIQILVCTFLYVGAYKVTGLSFSGSIPLLILIVLVQGLLVAIISLVLVTFFEKKVASLLVQVVLYFTLIFGGLVGPLDEWTGISIFRLLGKVKLDFLISEPYHNYVLDNSFGSVMGPLLLSFAVTVVLYGLAITAVKLGVGEKR
ncbi:MAG: ABC transporter permease [Bacillota bacterium]|nr:ABC transporter permease [Bacillota bacterium]